MKFEWKIPKLGDRKKVVKADNFPAPEEIDQIALQEGGEDALETEIKKEIDPLVEILCGDEKDITLCKKGMVKYILNAVKEKNATEKINYLGLKDTVKSAKDILNLNLHTALEHNRDYYRKEKPDKNFVKKAKIALIFQNDLTDFKKHSSRVETEWQDIRDLKNFIVNESDSRFTESDIDSLMKTKYKKNLTDSSFSHYIDKSYGTCDTIPKSLLIGLAQSEQSQRYYPIEYALKAAEKEKYDNETLEHLLASDNEKKVFENFDKFKGKPLEKILESGGLSSSDDSVSYLLSLNISFVLFHISS